MKNQLTDPRLESILYDEDMLAMRIEEIGREIARDYDAKTLGPLHLIGILKGACVFTCDLARALSRQGIPVILDFIRASTYKDGMKHNGEAQRHVEISGLTSNLHQCHVLLVDDVLDQGFTLAAVREYFLKSIGAASVKTCVCLLKALSNPSPEVLKLRESFSVDYHGLTIPDRWVVGYGLDIADEFRELPYVAIANEACFQS